MYKALLKFLHQQSFGEGFQRWCVCNRPWT